MATVIPETARSVGLEPGPGWTLSMPTIANFDDFRAWTRSEDFPEKSSITYVAGRLEIDMSPQRINRHAEVIMAVGRRLTEIAEREDEGIVNDQCTRVVLPEQETSCEPDLVYVTYDSLRTKRVVEESRDEELGDGLELVGPPDVVVEVVSRHSTRKDLALLHDAFESGGVREYWLIHPRREPAEFNLLVNADGKFVERTPDEEGWRRSDVFDREFRLTQTPSFGGRWRWKLEERGKRT